MRQIITVRIIGIMKHLYFVRHGLSVMNKKGIFSGRTETPLAPEGIDQTKLAAEDIKSLGIDCIITSPMERARQTADIIAREIGFPANQIEVHDFFMERAFGVLEGEPYEPDMEIDDIEGVERNEEILARARQGVAYLQSLPHDNILVVSHGAIGRAMRHILTPDVPFHGSERFKNAELVQLL